MVSLQCNRLGDMSEHTPRRGATTPTTSEDIGCCPCRQGVAESPVRGCLIFEGARLQDAQPAQPSSTARPAKVK